MQKKSPFFWRTSFAKLLQKKLLHRFSRFLFRFGLFRLFSFGGGLCLGHNRHIDPFEDGALAGVALALIEANDSGVAAVTILLGRSDFGEENFDRVFLMKAGHSKPAVVQCAVFAECHHLLGNRAGGFRLGQSCRDAFVLNEAANHVGKHRVAVLASAPEFGRSFKVSHKEIGNW
jgi:hypothetical protein